MCSILVRTYGLLCLFPPTHPLPCGSYDGSLPRWQLPFYLDLNTVDSARCFLECGFSPLPFPRGQELGCPLAPLTGSYHELFLEFFSLTARFAILLLICRCRAAIWLAYAYTCTVRHTAVPTLTYRTNLHAIGVAELGGILVSKAKARKSHSYRSHSYFKSCALHYFDSDVC